MLLVVLLTQRLETLTPGLARQIHIDDVLLFKNTYIFYGKLLITYKFMDRFSKVEKVRNKRLSTQRKRKRQNK